MPRGGRRPGTAPRGLRRLLAEELPGSLDGFTAVSSSVLITDSEKYFRRYLCTATGNKQPGVTCAAPPPPASLGRRGATANKRAFAEQGAEWRKQVWEEKQTTTWGKKRKGFGGGFLVVVFFFFKDVNEVC